MARITQRAGQVKRVRTADSIAVRITRADDRTANPAPGPM